MIISVPLQNFFLNTGTHNFHSSPVQPLHVVKRKAHDLGKSIRLDWYYTPAQSFLHCRQGCQEIRCNYRMPACVSPMHALHQMSMFALKAWRLYSRLLFMLPRVILSRTLCLYYRCRICMSLCGLITLLLAIRYLHSSKVCPDIVNLVESITLYFKA
jgi:hypothetical protein